MENIAQEIKREALKCVRCGFCRAQCPTLNVLGWDNFGPRGRAIVIKEMIDGCLKIEEAMVSIFSCVMCSYCDEVCPSSVKVSELVRKARVFVIKKLNSQS